MGNEGASLPAVLAAMPRPAGAPPVSVQPMPWTAAHAKLLTGFAGGSLPAIGQVGNSWLAEMAAIGAIAPVPRTLHGLLADQYDAVVDTNRIARSEEHTSELQSLMRNSYAVFCLKNKTIHTT